MDAKTMDTETMIALCKEHTFYSWAAQGSVDPLPVARAEGSYLYTPDGQKILDFNSQLMCVNIGHSHPKVLAAMKAAIDEHLLYVYPGTATEARARVGALLAEMAPGDLNTFFFTSAAPRPMRTRSGPPASTPGARRSSPATARTTAAPT
ncbi:MAG: aminotransferase class III-fold pyridoxal phosphate-dependent enzyme [Nannocystaceae bacterium]